MDNKTTDRTYAFIFRGLLTEDALDKAGRNNVVQYGVEENNAMYSRLGLDSIDESLVSSSRKMAIVYTAISAFENYVREFVEKKLLEEKGEGWWELSIPESIRKDAEKKKQAEDRVRWQSPRGYSLMNYIDFGDLISIIQKENNWPLFEPHIGKVEWARQISDTIEKARNVIMHSGVLGDKDIERLGMSIRDWIQQVG